MHQRPCFVGLASSDHATTQAPSGSRAFSPLRFHGFALSKNRVSGSQRRIPSTKNSNPVLSPRILASGFMCSSVPRRHTIPTMTREAGKSGSPHQSGGSNPSPKMRKWGWASAVGFIVILLVITVVVPNPTTTQFYIFRTVLAFAAAAFASSISGFLHVRLNGRLGLRKAASELLEYTIEGGGPLAAALVVYFFSPPALHATIAPGFSHDAAIKRTEEAANKAAASAMEASRNSAIAANESRDTRKEAREQRDAARKEAEESRQPHLDFEARFLPPEQIDSVALTPISGSPTKLFRSTEGNEVMLVYQRFGPPGAPDEFLDCGPMRETKTIDGDSILFGAFDSVRVGQSEQGLAFSHSSGFQQGSRAAPDKPVQIDCSMRLSYPPFLLVTLINTGAPVTVESLGFAIGNETTVPLVSPSDALGISSGATAIFAFWLSKDAKTPIRLQSNDFVKFGIAPLELARVLQTINGQGPKTDLRAFAKTRGFVDALSCHNQLMNQVLSDLQQALDGDRPYAFTPCGVVWIDWKYRSRNESLEEAIRARGLTGDAARKRWNTEFVERSAKVGF